MGFNILPLWPGKQINILLSHINIDNNIKVKEFCDVDQRKIGHYYEHQESTESPKPKISIHHFGSGEG